MKRENKLFYLLSSLCLLYIFLFFVQYHVCSTSVIIFYTAFSVCRIFLPSNKFIIVFFFFIVIICLCIFTFLKIKICVFFIYLFIFKFELLFQLAFLVTICSSTTTCLMYALKMFSYFIIF